MTELIEGILETALYVDDLDKAEAFYSDVLGFAKIRRGGNRHLFYRCGPGILLIFNAEETLKPETDGSIPVPPHGTRGQGHICFRVRAHNLDAMTAALKAADVAIEQEIVWPQGGRSIYFRDPAGNSLECATPKIWNMEEN